MYARCAPSQPVIPAQAGIHVYARCAPPPPVTPGQAGIHVYARCAPPPPVIPAKAGIHVYCLTIIMKQPCVYIMASQRRGTLYIGVTSDLRRRVQQHKGSVHDGFTSKYCVHDLVHVEHFGSMMDAIAREKQLKEWRRAWKLGLIETANPEWRDLYDEL